MENNSVLETQRTYLRRICLEDFHEIAAILGDIEVMYAWEHAFSEEEVRKWIEECMMRYTRDGYSYYAVIQKETGILIGVCGIIKEEADNQEYVGVGYIFNKVFWHQGYAFESASACKNYAFKHLHIPLLTAQIRPNNVNSKKIAAKLGMSVIKHFNKDYKENSVAHILYGCSK